MAKLVRLEHAQHPRARHALLTLCIGLLCAPTFAADSGCNWLDTGLGYVADGEFQRGQLRGLDRRGEFLILDLMLCRQRAQSASGAGYMSLVTRDLGLPTRQIEVRGGQQGRFRIDAHWRDLPGAARQALTPLQGVGSPRLILPSDWVAAASTAGMSALPDSLAPIELRTVRRQRQIALQTQIDSRWRFETQFHQHSRNGLRSIAGLIGNTGGNPRVIVLPEPVDQRTRIVDAGMRYAGNRWQTHLRLHLSEFDNNWSGLVWQNPYSAITGWNPAAGHPTGFGQLQLAPDNRFHQWILASAWQIRPDTRLNIDLASGQMRQNQAFLPYTIQPQLAVETPLPRDSLNGRIDTRLLQMRLHSRPAERWTWTASTRLDIRDNQTPRDEYRIVGGDSQDQNQAQASNRRRLNLPVSYREQRHVLQAGYRPSTRSTWTLGAEHRQIGRTWSARAEVRETLWKMNWRHRLDAHWSGGWQVDRSRRNGSTYLGNRPFMDSYASDYTDTVPGGFENLPDLRQFHLADRERQRARAQIQYAATAGWQIGASAGSLRDHYRRSEFGLTRSSIHDWTLDATGAVGENWLLHAHLARESMAFDQDARSFQGGANRLPHSVDPNRNFSVQHRDRVDSAGLGARYQLRGSPWSWRVDFAQNDADGRIAVSTGPALTSAPLPDSRARLRTFNLAVDRRHSEKLDWRLRYRAEQFDGADWAFDASTPGTLSNVILLGEQRPDYRDHALILSVRTSF